MADWHILGAGALGCLWGSYLHKAGQRVELLVKDQAGLSAYLVNREITLINGESKEKLPLAASVTGAGASGIEYLLIATKAHQTMTAIREAAPRLSGQCRLLLVQNGMGVAEQIAEEFPRLPLYCAVTTDGAYCPEPFVVVHAGKGSTYIGGYRNQHDPESLIGLLPTAWLMIRSCDDIESRQWQKLAINCAVNGLTVIFHCRNGELLEIEQARQRLELLCAEIARVGAAVGFRDWAADLYASTESVIRMTAANYSSMYQDIFNRRITEIDYINGYLIKQAQRLGIPCPENEALYREIKHKEQELDCRL